MSNEIQLTHDDAAETVYAIVRNQSGQWYVAATPETFESSHWSTYAIALSVVDSSSPPATGNIALQGTFPALAAGFYWLDTYIRAGATAAQTDVRLERRLVWWTGVGGTLSLAGGASNVRQVFSTTLATAKVPATVASGDLELSSANNQAITKAQYGVSGTVWHVKYDSGEDNSGDGLSWATAKLTAGAGVKTVIEAAAAGDLVLIGAGTFTIGNNHDNQDLASRIVTPIGVSIRGAGIEATILTSWFYGGDPIVGLGAVLSDMKIVVVGVPDNETQIPIGHDAGLENGLIERVHVVGTTDCALFGASAIIELDSCIFESNWDTLNIQGSFEFVRARNCVFSVLAPPPSFADIRAIFSMGPLELINCDLCVAGEHLNASYGIFTSGAEGKIRAVGCTISVSGGSSSFAAFNDPSLGEGTITLVGCTYDRTKTGGTIIDVPAHSTDQDGVTIQAASAAALAAYNTTGVAKEASVGAIATILAGITSLASWLRGLYRKDTINPTALAEINAVHDGGSAGTFSATTDSNEAIADKTSGLTAQETRDAMKLAPTAGDPAAGSIDAELDAIDTVVDAIKLKTDQIGTAQVTYSSWVTDGGIQRIFAGEDFLAADGRALSVTITDYAGPSLAGATAKMRILSNASYNELAADVGAADLEVTATISVDGTTVVVSADLTAAQTAAFSTSPPMPPVNYVYQFIATLSTTHKVMLTYGRMTVAKTIGAGA